MSHAASMRDRASMYSASRLKIGLFGPNCSSGRAVTTVPERWSGNWQDNLKLAHMADEAGLDFLLPIARWKGYGGDTDYQGATLETLTWACGLLASTRHITVFGTVHAPLFNPVIAAKEIVTADHIGGGRFGLNLVVGWNEGEFEIFGVPVLFSRSLNTRINLLHRVVATYLTPCIQQHLNNRRYVRAAHRLV